MPSGVAPCLVSEDLPLHPELLLPGVVLVFLFGRRFLFDRNFFDERGRDDLIPQVSE